jgi:hypothetical protein
MSDFNKVLAFQNIMPYLNQEQQEELANTLGLSLETIQQRLVGKNGPPISLDTDDPEIIEYVTANIR